MKPPKEQSLQMIDTLSRHCPGVEIGIIRKIERKGQSSMISGPISADPARLRNSLAWAAYENAYNEANVYVRPLPAQAHPWLFLDDLPCRLAVAISRKYAALIVQTSLGNCQARLLTAWPLNVRERGMVQVALVAKLKGSADPGSVAGDKWGRLPGFRQRKPGKEAWTNLIIDSTGSAPVFDASQYLVRATAEALVFSLPSWGGVGLGLKQEAGIGSGGGFREEFAYACHCLRRHEAEPEILRKIATHALARGKRRTSDQAYKYAKKLLESARGRLRA